MCAVKYTIVLTKNTQSELYVRTVCPWEATTNNMNIFGIPPHMTLLAKIKMLKCIIEDLNYL